MSESRRSYILHPAIGGPHPIPCLSTQITKRRGIAMYYIAITITIVFTRTVDAIHSESKKLVVSAFLGHKLVGRVQKFWRQNLQQNGRNGDTHSAECRSAFSVNFLVQMQNNWQWQQNPRHALSECMTSPDFYLLRRTQGQGNL